jgi:mannose-6-phosphate isomerase-like protein (cupin superfamily)
MTKHQIDDRFCTFCSKSRAEVQNLIAGPGEICICGDCVEICNQILQVDKRPPAAGVAGSRSLEVPFLFADFSLVAALASADGTTRHAFTRSNQTPVSVRLIDVEGEVRPHYHRIQTETYYFLEGEGSMELDGKSYPVKPGLALIIRPGTRHRAVKGATPMKLLSVVSPSLEEADEWFD